MPHSALVHGEPEGWFGTSRIREPIAPITRALWARGSRSGTPVNPRRLPVLAA